MEAGLHGGPGHRVQCHVKEVHRVDPALALILHPLMVEKTAWEIAMKRGLAIKYFVQVNYFSRTVLRNIV